MDRLEARVVLRAVQDGSKGIFPFVQGVDGFEQIVRGNLPEREPAFVTGLFDHLDEVKIIFPVPGQTEVVMHGGNCKGG